MSDTEVTEPDALPSERRIIAAVWPTLLASAVGLLPFTVFSTYLVQIADDTGDGDGVVVHIDDSSPGPSVVVVASRSDGSHPKARDAAVDVEGGPGGGPVER